MDKAIKILVESEKLAETILADKQEIISLSKRESDARMALSEMKKCGNQVKKVWITIGSLLMKTDIGHAMKLLEKDRIIVSMELNKLRSEMKVKVAKLQDIEYQKPSSAFFLEPLNRNELNAMKQCWGEVSN